MRATRRIGAAAGLWAMALAFGAQPAAAAPVGDGVRIDQMHPATPESPFFRVEGPHEPDVEGVEFAVGVVADYAKAPIRAFEVDTAGEKTPLPTPVDSAFLLHVGGSLTPVHWLNLDFSMPFALAESGDLAEGETRKVGTDVISGPAGQGVGDLRVGAHVRPIDDPAFGLLVGARFWAPFGSREAYLSDKNPRIEIDLGAAGQSGELLWGAAAGIGPGIFGGRNGDRVALSGALHLKLDELFSIGIEPAFAVAADVDRHDEVGFDVMFEPLGAARLYLGGFRVGVGAGPGFGSMPGTGEFRGLLSVGYFGEGRKEKAPPPGPKDADLDKIIDDQDACPTEAGPASKDPAKNGCPAQDRDADGVRDAEDFCPDRPGVKYDDPKANGCPDTDNDELPDPIDQCKSEPGARPSGCPKFARLSHDTFKIDPPIEFSARDAKLSAENQAALEEIAATMRANPKIEQVSVSLGTKGAPSTLTDKRAQRIILIFRGGNLDSSRYELVLRDDLKGGAVEVRVIR